MALISLRDVSVTFPVYDAHGRSLKLAVLRGVGSRVTTSTGRVNIEALRNVSLELRPGDRLAILGHNGAGKTTLLRVMAGIYEPRQGEVTIQGTMSSMTDLTMGMNGDATGRENIRLRCIFLGMRFTDIDRVIDEICDFTQLGEYLDLPIRTYSTGMLVRLGFAASTAVSPEILLMDEMIGAGDLSFANRAQARVANYLEGAKILVLASHNLTILRSFCNKGVLLESGQVVASGDLEHVVATYEARAKAQQ